MASDESVITIHEDDHDFDVYDHHHLHPHNMSRLSICSNSSKNNSFYSNDYEEDDDDDDGGDMSMFMSQLSIECSDGDADEELSDDDDDEEEEEEEEDDEKDRKVVAGEWTDQSDKEYSASENEIVQRSNTSLVRNRSRRSRMARERWLERAWEKKKYRAEGMMMSVDDGDTITMMMEQSNTNSPTSTASPTSGNSTITTASNNNTGSGVESDHQQHQCLLITRPNGGRRSLCMDMEEVRACRDLGFDLEHEKMTLEIPSSRISMSSSTIDTSSGGNSPIANWKISSPGDDPRDIKARLKVWAQAVALASASHLC